MTFASFGGDGKDLARLDTGISRDALVQLDGILYPPCAEDVRVIVRLHWLDRIDAAISVKVDHIQRKSHIVHPEFKRRFIGKGENHSMVARHGIPLHQAEAAVLAIGGDFERESARADRHLRGR